MSTGGQLVRNDPKKGNAKSEEAEQIPADEREVKKEKSHTATFNHHLALVVCVTDAHVRVVFDDEWEETDFVNVHQHRNEREHKKESDNHGVEQKIDGFENLNKSVDRVQFGDAGPAERNVKQ